MALKDKGGFMFFSSSPYLRVSGDWGPTLRPPPSPSVWPAWPPPASVSARPPRSNWGRSGLTENHYMVRGGHRYGRSWKWLNLCSYHEVPRPDSLHGDIAHTQLETVRLDLIKLQERQRSLLAENTLLTQISAGSDPRWRHVSPFRWGGEGGDQTLLAEGASLSRKNHKPPGYLDPRHTVRCRP